MFNISFHNYDQTLLNSNFGMSRISLCELHDCTMLCNAQVLALARACVSNDCTVRRRQNAFGSTNCTVANRVDSHRAQSSCISLFLPSFGVSRFSEEVRVCISALAQNSKKQLFTQTFKVNAKINFTQFSKIYER